MRRYGQWTKGVSRLAGAADGLAQSPPGRHDPPIVVVEVFVSLLNRAQNHCLAVRTSRRFISRDALAFAPARLRVFG